MTTKHNEYCGLDPRLEKKLLKNIIEETREI